MEKEHGLEALLSFNIFLVPEPIARNKTFVEFGTCFVVVVFEYFYSFSPRGTTCIKYAAAPILPNKHLVHGFNPTGSFRKTPFTHTTMSELLMWI